VRRPGNESKGEGKKRSSSTSKIVKAKEERLSSIRGEGKGKA